MRLPILIQVRVRCYLHGIVNKPKPSWKMPTQNNLNPVRGMDEPEAKPALLNHLIMQEEFVAYN